ncbi:HsdR family type I site-specific deoxyribonuclease [Metamycoplasma spumans]|uniref:HsdR family type I site-specific deoxyribonuclease n=1 Tax=Metamycoplasma spumans TaxID=92406 RepID=UPI0034DD0D38
MSFNSEKEFANNLIQALQDVGGWPNDILEYKSEKDLIKNWANIIYENNRSIDRLDKYPLTDTEMDQIINQIEDKKPFHLNKVVNNKVIKIVRDNKDDEAHYGQEISLFIFDKKEITSGKTRYQIAKETWHHNSDQGFKKRRGDITLLINGMPLIHIELKKSGVPISEACNQIQKYSDEGAFGGIFKLIQIFVCMTPENMLYFANPGQGNVFNKDYFFKWANFYNEPINNWKEIAREFLSIKNAHELIGYYTISDKNDETLKVLRSYQCYAVQKIKAKFIESQNNFSQKGGYIAHTTGSGKTMTSFKAAQIIADLSNSLIEEDKYKYLHKKVVFLTDRIDLGVQSVGQYKNFAEDNETVNDTANTTKLFNLLMSNNIQETLIVTSIQKMSKINKETYSLFDLEKINEKRIVFIVDECHRSTFGNMLLTIKETFPGGLFFGFTGTPIKEINKKNDATTREIFGEVLHTYSIVDGIRDHNVLGFAKYPVETFTNLRQQVALDMADAIDLEDAKLDDEKWRIYQKYLDANLVPMASEYDEDGKLIRKGIEELAGNDIYGPDYKFKKDGSLSLDYHKVKVVEDIFKCWDTLSNRSKFHAIFATASIKDAIEYYTLLKDKNQETNKGLKFAFVFDNSDDNSDSSFEKNKATMEMLNDYNKNFNKSFTLENFDLFKKDLASRLSHKDSYKNIHKDRSGVLDLVIVVRQMLTGYDSKWVNTLYLDKVLEYEELIQAFSRTNRLFGRISESDDEKPWGNIRYYRKPYTMNVNIDNAFRLYSNSQESIVFADKIESNIKKINDIANQIIETFEQEGIENFSKLPDDQKVAHDLVSKINNLAKLITAVKLQGFVWPEDQENDYNEILGETIEYDINIDKDAFETLMIRASEYVYEKEVDKELPNRYHHLYELEGGLKAAEVSYVDYNYLEKFFSKLIIVKNDPKLSEDIIKELNKSFAKLSPSEQNCADRIIIDVLSDKLKVEEGKTFKYYLTYYMENTRESKIKDVADNTGIDINKFNEFINTVRIDSFNEYGKLDNLLLNLDKTKLKEFLESKLNIKIEKMRDVNRLFENFIKDFVISIIKDYRH